MDALLPDTPYRYEVVLGLDNFFFPGGDAARYYLFSYGGLADFFALDTTAITGGGRPAPSLAPDGEQFLWLANALASSKAPWRIAFFHHPPFTAGPRHEASLEVLLPVVDLFEKYGVPVAFTGHEHNLQFSRRNQQTRGTLYVVTGSGGELRRGDVRSRMADAQVAGWAPQHHFLLVEIEDRQMRITPLGYASIQVRDAGGKSLPMPVLLDLP